MNKTSLLLALACLFALAPSARLVAQDNAGHHHGDHEDTDLGKKMKKMGKAFRQLGRQINDAAKNEDSLALVATMREAAEASLQYQPEKTADLPEADRAKFVADYQSGIKGLIADLDKLAAALKANDNAAAAGLLRQIKDDQKQGHHEFRKEHGKDHGQ